MTAYGNYYVWADTTPEQRVAMHDTTLEWLLFEIISNYRHTVWPMQINGWAEPQGYINGPTHIIIEITFEADD